MLLITAFIHTSQLAFPPTGNKECHAFWTVKVLQHRVHLQQGDAARSGQQVGTGAVSCSTSAKSQVAPLVEHGCLNATCSLGETWITPTSKKFRSNLEHCPEEF